ncbi:MAG: hypothetical protein M3419_08020 [Actinomycetota bacterium]|nr:hypothetical protein [Actinomycetota bacterium]
MRVRRMGVRRVLRAVESRVLAAAPATRPAVLRLVTGGWTAYYLSQRVDMLKQIHRGDARLFAPVGPCRVLRRPLPPTLADAITYAELAADLAFTAGVRHRVVGPVHAGLLLWTLSYRNSWSMIFHNDNNLVLHTAVLGLSPSADSLSVDALVAHRRLDPQLCDWRYGLPTRVINAVTTATYLVAGVAKLKGPLGWSWATGESLRSQIAADGLRKELLGSAAAPVGLRMYGQTQLFRMLAVGSLVIELAAPLALVDRRLGRAWAIGAFGMHWGIYALMGIKFRYQLSGAIFASFFPVDRLPVRHGRP